MLRPNYNINEIRSRLKSMLTKKRYLHTLGTEETALRLGKIYYHDYDRLSIAALLHDVGKSLNYEKQLEYIESRRILLSPDDIKAKGTIHAKVGRVIAEAEFGIKDPEILDAIAYHPTGNGNMTMLQKIVFASDYLDPNRGYKENKNIFELIENDFEKGILQILKLKIIYILQKNEHLHPLSIEFYNKQLELSFRKVNG